MGFSKLNLHVALHKPLKIQRATQTFPRPTRCSSKSLPRHIPQSARRSVSLGRRNDHQNLYWRRSRRFKKASNFKILQSIGNAVRTKLPNGSQDGRRPNVGKRLKFPQCTAKCRLQLFDRRRKNWAGIYTDVPPQKTQSPSRQIIAPDRRSSFLVLVATLSFLRLFSNGEPILTSF